MINKNVEKYINLCINFCTKPDDYTKRNVKKHNKAMLELLEFINNLSKDRDSLDKMLKILLNNENDNVRISAATHCLKFKLHEKSAENILEKTCSGDDKIAAFGAEMTLKVWRGEIPGKTL